MKIRYLILSIVVTALLVCIWMLSRDGKLITPVGKGTVELPSGNYEAYPIPDYISDKLSNDYKSYLVEVEPGIKIHILEIGSGFPVYMQHGNPTSGLLYRHIAERLPIESFRMIMPTLPGLGFSSKVPASEHQLENHIRWMSALLDKLNIEKLLFVGQDWGGPIGMGALARNPEKLMGAVILNTGWTAPDEPRDLSRAHALAKTPVIGELMLEVLVSIFDRLPQVQGDEDSMPPTVIDLYKRPVIESNNTKAPLALMRMVPDGPSHPSVDQIKKINAYVGSIDVPTELVWGINDPILGNALPLMQANFPKAKSIETSAGHFLQEEVPDEITSAILRVHSQIKSDVSLHQ